METPSILAPSDVVILNNVAVVRFVRVDGGPDCTYEIWINEGHVKPVEQGLLLHATITYQPNQDAYSILLGDEPTLTCTDSEDLPPGCNSLSFPCVGWHPLQLRLTPLQGPIPDTQLVRGSWYSKTLWCKQLRT
ncbi:hypothetical protein V8B97DRAFT_1918494 [Scleroderma yunnanense]